MSATICSNISPRPLRTAAARSHQRLLEDAPTARRTSAALACADVMLYSVSSRSCTLPRISVYVSSYADCEYPAADKPGPGVPFCVAGQAGVGLPLRLNNTTLTSLLF